MGIQSRALSPLDGRYAERMVGLSNIFSEFGLVKRRLMVEVEYLIALSQVIDDLAIAVELRGELRGLVEDFSETDYERVKSIERQVQHDVKAVEYFLGEQLEALDQPELRRWVHFGLTSEDVTNLAIGLQMQEGLAWLVERGARMQVGLVALIEDAKTAVMVGRTHGQPAVPTTMGKELLVFALQFQTMLERLQKFELQGKVTGAVGTLAAQRVSFPAVDWIGFSRKFVEGLGFKPVMVTTQVLPPRNWMALFSLLEQLSLLYRSLCEDVWWYISMGYFAQEVKQGEVGSSTMPQKVNPIRFENAEGNAFLAAQLFGAFCETVSHSRLQRDLSGSTVRRNYGTAWGHLALAMESMQQGIGRLQVDEEWMLSEVQEHPEMLAEAVQVLLKKAGDEEGYEKVKERLRGVATVEWPEVVSELEVSGSVRNELMELRVEEYVGYAVEVVEAELEVLRKRVEKMRGGTEE